MKKQGNSGCKMDNNDILKAIKRVKMKLIEMDKEEFYTLLEKHKEGEIAKMLSETGGLNE
jgi:hypothetical protein